MVHVRGVEKRKKEKERGGGILKSKEEHRS